MTFAGAEKCRVAEQQQDVVQEALQHRRLHTSLDQVLRADRRPTDEQRQDLAHHNGLQKFPVQKKQPHKVLEVVGIRMVHSNSVHET